MRVRGTWELSTNAVESVKKYWHVINIGIQNTLVYRFNFLVRSLFGLIPLLATILLWKAIYASREDAGDEIEGYTLAGMISYYLVVTLVDMFTGVNEDDWQIAADIRDGNLNQFLLKPIDYLWFRFWLFVAGRSVYTLVALIPVGLFIFFQREYFVAPASAGLFGWFVLSTLMTALLQFFMSYTMALLAFWVLEVSTFIFILFAFEYIAGGHLFPLDILPPVLENVLRFTPFPYQMFFPVSIYLGRTTGAELFLGLGIQAFWVVASFFIAGFVWKRGLKRYTAVGG